MTGFKRLWSPCRMAFVDYLPGGERAAHIALAAFLARRRG